MNELKRITGTAKYTTKKYIRCNRCENDTDYAYGVNFVGGIYTFCPSCFLKALHKISEGNGTSTVQVFIVSHVDAEGEEETYTLKQLRGAWFAGRKSMEAELK